MRAVLVVACCLLFSAQAAPPRDTSAGAATGIIRGRIVSAASGEPLHRVRLTINTGLPNPPSAVTDTRGQFEVVNVPAGSHSLTAQRAGYLTVQYGQRRPREAGRMIEVRGGQVVEGIDIALPRAAALAGVITDDINDHYAGVRVEALEFRYLRGRRVLVQAGSATTNDLGEFRIGGLAPGTYVLRASTTDVWDGDDGKSSYTYANTYYPGVTGLDQAQSVNLNVGQEAGGLDLSVRPGRSARIHGVLQNAAGEPMPAQAISLSPTTRGIGGVRFSSGGPASRNVRTDRDGTFDLPNLPPGEYLVAGGGESERTTMTVIVSDGDVRAIVLSPRKPSSLAGTVMSDDGTPIPFAPSRLRVIPVSADPDSVFPPFVGPQETPVGRDWTFRWTNAEGRFLFRVMGLPAEWMLSAVTFNGRAHTDVPLEIAPGGMDLKGLQLVLSQKGGAIDGDVIDAGGKPVPDSTVVVFAADASRWTLASRFIKAARPESAGKFAIGGLPPGIYRIVARDFVAEGQWEDPEFLTSVAASATRVELAEGGREKVSLKLELPR